MQPTLDSVNYFLDVSPLVTGVGLHPFHRGLELTNASQRAWRLDYYKDGPSGAPYSTIMSGARQQLTSSQHRLTVDLQLRWSEEVRSVPVCSFLDHVDIAMDQHTCFLVSNINCALVNNHERSRCALSLGRLAESIGTGSVCTHLIGAR